MRFTTSLAVVAAAVVPAALAQSVNINAATLTQCATTTLTFRGSTGPYYVAVVPANDPCTEDALAEFYDVGGNSVDYYVNQPAGTSVQLYVLDVNGVETWGQIETVGGGDGSCLPGYVAPANPATDATSSSTSSTDAATSSTDPATSSTDPATSTSSPVSSSSPVSLYTPPSPSTTAAALTHSSSGSSTGSSNTNNSNSDNSTNDTTTSADAPVNAASSNDTSGASSLTASVTLLVGAFAAVVALF